MSSIRYAAIAQRADFPITSSNLSSWSILAYLLGDSMRRGIILGIICQNEGIDVAEVDDFTT